MTRTGQYNRPIGWLKTGKGRETPVTLAFGAPTSVQIPTIITDRLVLRSWRAADVLPYSLMNSDDETTRYLGGTFDLAVTERLVAHLTGMWHIKGFSTWAVELRADGSFAGRAGLYEAAGWPAPEVNWSIRRDLWSRGLATEAGAAALEFAFQQLAADRVIAIIHQDNTASIKVATKLGAVFTEIATISAWVDSAVYTVTRAAWAHRHGDAH